MRQSCHAFTLAELLVSVAILTLLTLIVSRMVNSAAIITTLGNRGMDTESQVRPVLARISLDLIQMLKRPDVDYYGKGNLDPETGNDRIAFFCNAPGYYPSTGSQSPFSLVSYRINSNPASSSLNKMERMSKGLLWNGVPVVDTPMLFGLQTIVNNWPAATSSSTSDPDYELIGPQIFRFEYYYILKTGGISDQPGADGLQDVTAIVVTIAAIDQKSRVSLSNAQLGALGGQLKDFDPTKPGYDLMASWRDTLNSVTDMPRIAINGVRIYQRYVYLRPPQ
ncbi:MAG TPA: prepilin-type N-terminal cleavage/methylation domain-containing protein [Chthoniobacterales bacterium]|jgi:prepilin-type N-terminal cleavage/methylation domain-containing protein